MSKPFKTYDEQIEILSNRGLDINNPEYAIRHSGGTAQAHPVSLLVLKILSKHMTILIFLIDNIHQIQKIVNPVCEKYICFKREI